MSSVIRTVTGGSAGEWWDTVRNPGDWFSWKTPSTIANERQDAELQAQEAAKAMAKVQADAKAKYDAEQAAATAKTAADKATADQTAADAEAWVAMRRRANSPYGTSGGAAGLLGGSPVKLKVLLGE